MAQDDIFTVERAGAGYGKEPVLKDFTFSVRPGDFMALIGPNGAGKSTLMKLLSGIMRPWSGRVAFRGRSLADMPLRSMAREFSVVHQSGETVPAYTVEDFVGMGLFPHRGIFSLPEKKDRVAVEEALELCDMARLRMRPLTALSGGERQLAFIARALVQNREVILLDESVSHLDVRHVKRIMDILYGLNRDGSTIITVLHDLNLAADYCGRIMAVRDGRIFFDGRPEDVIRYDLIEKLFDTVCVVQENPISGRPFAYTVPEHIRKR